MLSFELSRKKKKRMNNPKCIDSLENASTWREKIRYAINTNSGNFNNMLVEFCPWVYLQEIMKTDFYIVYNSRQFSQARTEAFACIGTRTDSIMVYKQLRQPWIFAQIAGQENSFPFISYQLFSLLPFFKLPPPIN